MIFSYSCWKRSNRQLQKQTTTNYLNQYKLNSQLKTTLVLMTTKIMVESAWAEDMGQFRYHLDLDTRKISRILEKIKLKMINKQCSIVFNKICLYIYIYIYMCVCVCVCVFVCVCSFIPSERLMWWLNKSITELVDTKWLSYLIRYI